MGSLFCGCGVLLLTTFGLLPLAITYFSIRRTDPEHALRRTMGMGLVILGVLVMAVGSLALLGTLVESDTVMFEQHFEPDKKGVESYYHPTLGPSAVSVWLFLAGSIIGCGWFLFARQFSLRSLLIGLLLVALVASIPHLTIHPQGPKAVITARINRILTLEEWASLERAFSRERLYTAVSDPTQKALPCPITDALKEVELQPQTKGGLESEGKDGVRLTLRFSQELEREQVEAIFNELSSYVEKTMPVDSTP
jgi:hypothetical protein